MLRHLLTTTLILAAAAPLVPNPAAAQRLEPGCTRERVRPERPDRRRPAEIARDSLEQAIEESLRLALLRAAAEAGIESPSGIVAVEIDDRASGRARAGTYRSELPQELVTRVVDGSAAELARLPGRENFFTLRLDRDERPEPRPGEVIVECRPIPLNGEAIRAHFDAYARREGLHMRVRGFSADVRFLVTRDGEVAYVAPLPASISPAHQEYLHALVRGFRFRPASVAGKALDVWVMQQFYVLPQR